MHKPWCLPKGWLDDAGPGLPGPFTLGQKKATSTEVEQSALREVREESGIEAKIIERLGTEQFFFVDRNKEKVFKTVIFFLMEYVRDLPEGFDFETSEIRWVTADEALLLLKPRPGESALITKASLIINS